MAVTGLDGEKGKQGGCLQLASPRLPTQGLLSFSNGVCEVQVSVAPSIGVLIANVYRPPDASMCKFQEALGKVDDAFWTFSINDTNLILTGDFNFLRA